MTRISTGMLFGMTCMLGFACSQGGFLDLVGTLERSQIELVAPVSETIVEVPVVRGENVAKGDAIVRLDPTLARAELRRAEAVRARARTAARVAANDLGRARELGRRAVTSEQELERAALERDETAAALLEAEAMIDVANKRLNDLVLRAPIDAVVDQLPYEAGERVPAGAVLAVLFVEERPWVRIWLPEPYLARVRPGFEVEVRLDGWADPLSGNVLEIAREPTFTPHYALTERERAHLAYETRVELVEPPEGVRPGVPATVRLAVELPEQTRWFTLPFGGDR